MTGSKGPRRTGGAKDVGPTKSLGTRADAQLVIQLHAHDAQAFEILFEQYFDALVRFAYYLLGVRDTAQDIVQDVFLHVWDHPETIDPTRSLKRYLYRAVQNRALNERRNEAVKARHQEATLTALASDTSLGETPSRENAILSEATVQTAIGRLSGRRQEAVQLRLREQLTHAEIGQILGISTVAAERLVQRALDDLQKILRVLG